jgi:hypothetical protein
VVCWTNVHWHENYSDVSISDNQSYTGEALLEEILCLEWASSASGMIAFEGNAH